MHKLKKSRYARYLDARYGEDREYPWIVDAQNAWRHVKADELRAMQDALDGGMDISYVSTRSEFRYLGYDWVVKIEGDDMVDLGEHFQCEIVQSRNRPQSRNGKEVSVQNQGQDMCIATLEFDLHTLRKDHWRNYGKAEAYRRAVKDVRRQRDTLQDYARGDDFFVIVTVECEALNVDESCGGFEHDDKDGIYNFVYEHVSAEIESALHDNISIKKEETCP